MEGSDTRPFPIQGGVKRGESGEVARPIVHEKSSSIPWWLAEEAYAYYTSKYSGQLLEELAKRGGFGRAELLMLLRREDN